MWDWLYIVYRIVEDSVRHMLSGRGVVYTGDIVYTGDEWRSPCKQLVMLGNGYGLLWIGIDLIPRSPVR